MTDTNAAQNDAAQNDESQALPPEQAASAILALEAELAEMKDRLLRAVAETENVRRRAERERAEEKKYAITRFARDLTGVADNLSRALKAVPDDQKNDPAMRALIDGVELTERELLSVFEKNGVKRIVPAGEPFNPNFHQAVAEIPVPGATAGTVLEVIEAGYVIDERLIRPAMVVIAKAPAANVSGVNVDTSA
jgi:molecular chaperone GrpE